jgi:hypothetical protein
MPNTPPNPSSSGNGQHADFVGRVGHLNESAHQLMDEARSTLEDLGHALDLTGRVQRHPYGMVATALGLGYVLGGGLLSPLTFRLVGMGVRLAAIPLLRNKLLGLAEAAVSGFTSEGSGDGPSSPSPSPS